MGRREKIDLLKLEDLLTSFNAEDVQLALDIIENNDMLDECRDLICDTTWARISFLDREYIDWDEPDDIYDVVLAPFFQKHEYGIGKFWYNDQDEDGICRGHDNDKGKLSDIYKRNVNKFIDEYTRRTGTSREDLDV